MSLPATPPPASTTLNATLFSSGSGPWQERLDAVVEMMRELSSQNDPQSMIRNYMRRVRALSGANEGVVAISRRDLAYPWFRVTRSSRWNEQIDPWRQRERLPLLQGGFFAELLYGDRPAILNDLNVPPDDPAAEYLEGMGSAMAIPNFDQGIGINMGILLRRERGAFDLDQLPENVWMSNLIGRATHNLVLRREVEQAYQAVDRELLVVADIQRSLLPATLPHIETLELASHYQTSRRAGGDYYDFFPLPEGRWGILIADVSGHGTPAAVLMAVTHSIAHTHDGPPQPPSKLLDFINRHLAARYTGNGSFVTALYGIYDPAQRRLVYACAGHPPLRRCGDDGAPQSLPATPRLPLGIDPDEHYVDETVDLTSGDVLVFFTDGITEAKGPGNALFGVERLDAAMRNLPRPADPVVVKRAILAAVEQFTGFAAPDDDRTLLVAKVT